MPSYFFLPSQKVTLLLIPYHFTIPPTSKNSIFIKILLFNLSLLFFYPIFYFMCDSISWAFQPFLFFLRLPQPLAKSTNTNHKHKPSNPRRISRSRLNHNPLPQPFFFFLSLPQPLAQTTNTNKHKPTPYQSPSLNHNHTDQKHKPTPIRNPRHQTIKPTKPPVRNPRRRFETQPI